MPDPYFGGEGPDRAGCIHCGGCMVGCRHNAKNTLVKNYLYFAEKAGVEIRAEAQVQDIRPLPSDGRSGARYEVVYQRSTAWLPSRKVRVKARNVVVAAGVLGTLKLLFKCRDTTGSLAKLSLEAGRQCSHEQRGAAWFYLVESRNGFFAGAGDHIDLSGRSDYLR